MFARPGHRVTLLILTFALLLALPGVAAAAPTAPASSLANTAQANERDLYIVVQTAPPVALYQGGIDGLAATNPEALGEVKLDASSLASQAYRDYLRAERGALLGVLAATLGRDIEVVNHYDWAINGFAAELTGNEANAVREVPGVSFVHRNETLETLTDAGPEWIEADDVWNGTATSAPGNKGEGIVAGIIDTGVNPGHPSFAATGPVDGYVHTNPRPNYYGVCVTEPVASDCNAKLIGMYDFLGGTGVDDNGHGSHTASTVAGNVVDATLVTPTTTLPVTQISGVAPHANIISYRACQTAALPVVGTCPLNALIAAIDTATQDVPDVINFSIGGGSTDPWTDPLGQSFFGAHAAGVFVATSAGNSGPGSQTIGRPSNSPWLLATGASTSNRRPTGVITATKTNGDPLVIEGRSLTTGIAATALVDAAAIGNELCGAFTAPQAAQVAGKVVICVGSTGRVAKGTAVATAGGVGMILVSSPGYKASDASDAHVIPTVHIGEWQGAELREWLVDAIGPQVALTGVNLETNNDLGDRMAGFSSRGPDLSNPDVIKPDVTAPGVSILAAFANDPNRAGDDYGMIQGTSMSSPHAAGAGALLAALHPDWTPDQIKSALMSTAFTVVDGGKETVPVTKEDHETPADPFDRGGGRINISAAARAGLTVDESVENYQAANPASGGESETLNLANLAQSSCNPSCSWTRTVTSTQAVPVNYTVTELEGAGFSLTVTPSSFNLAAGGSQELTITATNTGLQINAWEFGEVRFDPDVSGLPTQHFPVAVKKGTGPAPAPDCEITPTVVSSANAAANVADYNDIRTVSVAGIYPTFGGETAPNVRFAMTVEELGVAGSLPPNQHWQVEFIPPGVPAGTSYFVSMITSANGEAKFEYGRNTTTQTGTTFEVLGAPDGGEYDLVTSTINWAIKTDRINNPEVGEQLTEITGQSGAALEGTVTTNVKTTPAGTYTFTSCSVDVRPDACTTPPFSDVPVEHPFCPEILWAKTNGIANGYADGTYRPSSDITRMAMAAFLARFAEASTPNCSEAPFPDVPADHPFCPHINWMKTEGITTGFEDGTFRPEATVTRQAMAAFLARVADATLTDCTEPPFTDVPIDHPFCKEIGWLKNNGIADGFEDGTFRPSINVTRQAMAAFLFRTSLHLP